MGTNESISNPIVQYIDSFIHLLMCMERDTWKIGIFVSLLVHTIRQKNSNAANSKQHGTTWNFLFPTD